MRGARSRRASVALAFVTALALAGCGDVRRGWLGVTIQDLDRDLAEALGLSIDDSRR